MHRRLVTATALFAVAFAACASPSSTAPTPSRHRYTVTIGLNDGQKVPGPDLQVPLTVYGLHVVNKIGETNKKDEGHIYYYLDVDKIPTTLGKSAEASGEGHSHETSDTGYIWKDVEVGKHKIAVQLVNNDGTPFEPPAIDEKTINVVKEASRTG